MILLISEDDKKYFILQERLSSHFTILKTISEEHSPIPIFCFNPEQDSIFYDYQNIILIPKWKYNILIRR